MVTLKCSLRLVMKPLIKKKTENRCHLLRILSEFSGLFCTFVSHFVKNIVGPEVSGMPPKELNYVNVGAVEGNEESGGFTETSHETTPSLHVSEELSDGQEKILNQNGYQNSPK